MDMLLLHYIPNFIVIRFKYLRKLTSSLLFLSNNLSALGFGGSDAALDGLRAIVAARGAPIAHALLPKLATPNKRSANRTKDGIPLIPPARAKVRFHIRKVAIEFFFIL